MAKNTRPAQTTVKKTGRTETITTLLTPVQRTTVTPQTVRVVADDQRPKRSNQYVTL